MSDPTAKLAIVFADVSGSTRLFDELGNATAARIVGRALSVMSKAVTDKSGRVVRTIGDEVFCTFEDAAAAFSGVLEIQSRVKGDGLLAKHKVSIRIGMHYGRVLFGQNELFGDAINVAARMAKVARANKIITTRATAAFFPTDARRYVRPLPAVTVPGKRAPIEVVEIVWQDDLENLTTLVDRTLALGDSPLKLILRYDGRDIEVQADSVPFVLGRDPTCDLPVDYRPVSRRHASIELHGQTFVIKDHSTNGTIVTMGAGESIRLHRNHLPLTRSGTISLGRGVDAAAHMVHFTRAG